ncbi:MAG: hypothetical protein ACP5GI_07030 [Sulfolobales archaeon]
MFIEIAKSLKLSSYILLAIVLLGLDTALWVTGLTIYSLINVAEYLVKVSSDEILITSYSISPFTSLVNINSVRERIGDIWGRCVDSFEPINLALVNINSTLIVLRGVSDASKITVSEGERYDPSCLNCAWIGESVKRELGLEIGDLIVVESIFIRVPMILRVAGIYESGYLSDKEIIVSYKTASILRGADPSYASILIIRPRNSECINEILARISSEKFISPERIIVAIRYVSAKNISSKLISALSDIYLARLGLHRDIFTVLAISIAIILSYAYFITGSIIYRLNTDRIRILHNIGVSKRNIFAASLILYVLIFSVVFISSLYLSIALISMNIRIFGYELLPRPDISVASYYYLLTLALGVIGLLREGGGARE